MVRDQGPPREGAPLSIERTDDDTELLHRLRTQVARYCPRRLTDRIEDIVQVAWMRLERARRRDGDGTATPGASLIARV